MNYARYMAGTLVKSTLKLTKIHWKLKDLSMAFLEIDQFVVFLCKIRGKGWEKWDEISKGNASESGWT